MKKSILTLLVICAFVAASAQFTMGPLTKTATGSSAEAELVTKAYVKNTGTATKTFVWRLNRKNFPSAWKASLCDKNLCYDVDVSRAEFDLAAGDSGNMDIHLYPNDAGGIAEAEIEVFILGDSANSVTGTYTFSAWTLSTGKVTKKPGLEIYPNPATTRLNISLETNKPVTLEVYNVLGQLKATHVHNGGNSVLELGDMPAGVYFIRYTNDEGKVISKQFKKVQ